MTACARGRYCSLIWKICRRTSQCSSPTGNVWVKLRFSVWNRQRSLYVKDDRDNKGNKRASFRRVDGNAKEDVSWK